MSYSLHRITTQEPRKQERCDVTWPRAVSVGAFQPLEWFILCFLTPYQMPPNLSVIFLLGMLWGSDTFGQCPSNTNPLQSPGDKQVMTFKEEITPFRHGHKALALGSVPFKRWKGDTELANGIKSYLGVQKQIHSLNFKVQRSFCRFKCRN